MIGNLKRNSSGSAKLDEEWRDYMLKVSVTRREIQKDEERRQFFFDHSQPGKPLPAAPLEQLNTAEVSKSQREAAELIVGNIDELGFLQSSLEEISQNTTHSVPELPTRCSISSKLHPVGVGARDLKDVSSSSCAGWENKTAWNIKL